VALNFDAQTTSAYPYEFATEKQTVNGQETDVISRDAMGNPKAKLDAAGKPVPFQIAYPEKDEKGNFQSHPTAGSVVSIHNFGWMFVQATIAILILVGFESVTAMGGEAKNPKRDIPIAVTASLLIQGGILLLDRVFRGELFSQFRLSDDHGYRIGGAYWRHDDLRGRCVIRRRQRQNIYAG
jgi:hypothetical protein